MPIMAGQWSLKISEYDAEDITPHNRDVIDHIRLGNNGG